MKPFCFSILFLIVYDLQGLNDSIWWIPNKEYFKIEIEESSWYRIDNQLIRDFNKVSLFHHGKRQKVYFVEETDSEFYGIYFFGKENSIEFDLKLFQKNRRSLNYKKGLLNKSSPYFLCFEPSLFEEDYFVKIKDPQELPSMFEPRCVNWDNFYFKPRIGPEQLIANSFFDDGEGFGSTPSRNYQFEIFGQETLHFRLANLGKLNNIQIKVDGKTLYRKNGLVPFELIIDSIMLDFPKIYKIEWIADEEVTVGSFCSGRVVIAPGIRDIIKISPSVIPTIPVNPANFIIIASAQFKRDAQVLEQYLQFRNKDFDSALYFQDDLDNLFGYGYSNHPLSVSRFIKYLDQNLILPDFVFLIGKGISYPFLREGDYSELLPVFGFPGSDLMLIDPFQEYPNKIAVGRLSVDNPAQIRNYLDKVIAFENQINVFWKKRVLLTFGGKNPSEYSFNKELIEKLIPNIQSSFFSGEVNIVERNSSGNYYGKITDFVNKGLGYKVFLGHGNITSTENALDNPSLFMVENKFPVLLSLGCQTGNPFTPLKSLGESFIENTQGGSIAYWGSSGYGYPSEFIRWSKDYFSFFGNDFFNKPIGIPFYKALGDNSPLNTQMIFQGDPAISFKMDKKSVYDIPFSTIEYDLNTELFSFDILNSGKVTTDTIVIHFEGIRIPKKDTIFLHKSKTAYKVKIPIQDLGEQIEILSDDFQKTIWPTKQYKSPVELIYPFDNSIIKEVEPIFTVKFLNDDMNFQNIQIIIDTCYCLNSPMQYSENLNFQEEIIQVNPEINFNVNQLYYWKISNAEFESSIYSFKISDNQKTGWEQSKIPQFYANHMEGIQINPDSGFTGNEIYNSFLIQAGVRNDENQFRSRLFQNGERIINATISPSIYLQTIDPRTAKPVDQKVFQSPYLNLHSYLQNSIPEGFWVILFTFQKEGELLIQKDVRIDDFIQFMQNQGAKNVEILFQNLPYIAVFQKNIGMIKEIFGNPSELLLTIPYSSEEGIIETRPIGPAAKFESIQLMETKNPIFSFNEKNNYLFLKAEFKEQSFKNEFTWSAEFTPLRNHVLKIKNLNSFYFPRQIINLEIQSIALQKKITEQKLDLKLTITDLGEIQTFFKKNLNGSYNHNLSFNTSGIKLLTIQLYDQLTGTLIDEARKKIEIINELNISDVDIQINQTPYTKGMTIGKKNTFWSLVFNADIQMIPKMIFNFKNGQTDTVTAIPQITVINSSFRYQWRFNYDFESSGDLFFKVEFDSIFLNRQIEGNIRLEDNSAPEILYTYPNPFTSKMRFVYRYFGSNDEITDFTIFIHTLTGRLIKTITSRDFGLLKNGEHLSDYEWDGKDEFGNETAKGIYFFISDIQNSKTGKIYKLK